MILRPYQLEALEATVRDWEQTQSVLNVLPTGTGKTVIFAHIIKARTQGRVMVLAHREELIAQAAGKILAVTGEAPEIEMADRRADLHMFNRARVIVSSIQTQIAGKPRRMERFNPADFGTLIIDEAHHAPAPSYREVLAWYRQNPALKVLGVTATPDRADEAALGQIFERVSYIYEITDAIRDGYLVPIHARSVMVEGLDYSEIRTTAGDLNGADLARVMSNEELLQQIASATLAEAGDRKSIVFAPPGFKRDGDDAFRVSERLTEILNRHRPECARLVSQDTPSDLRRQIFRDYADRRFQHLVNVGIATEGFDDPGIELVVLARPTKSRALFAQMVGRGTRPLPGLVDQHDSADARREAIATSTKPNIEVLDFVGNTGRHKLITVADILGGKHSEEAISRATKRAQEAGELVDTARALDEAEAEIHAEKERARQEEADRRRPILGKARYQTRTVNPFDILAIEPARQYAFSRTTPPTEKQIATLARFGVPAPESRAEASQLLEACFGRIKAGKCTFRQARILAARGLSIDCSATDASDMIDEIAAKEGWQNRKARVPA